MVAAFTALPAGPRVTFLRVILSPEPDFPSYLTISEDVPVPIFMASRAAVASLLALQAETSSSALALAIHIFILPVPRCVRLRQMTRDGRPMSMIASESHNRVFLIAKSGVSVPVRVHVDKRATRVSVRIDPTAREAVATAPNLRHALDAISFANERVEWIAERLAPLPPTSRSSPAPTFP